MISLYYLWWLYMDTSRRNAHLVFQVIFTCKPGIKLLSFMMIIYMNIVGRNAHYIFVIISIISLKVYNPWKYWFHISQPLTLVYFAVQMVLDMSFGNVDRDHTHFHSCKYHLDMEYMLRRKGLSLYYVINGKIQIQKCMLYI